jgi:hypothetical protein
MAVTVIATAGLNTSNSYATVDEADDYHEHVVHKAAWDAADDDTKGAALIEATRLLDAHYIWNGTAVDDIQVLCWPRAGLMTRTGYTLSQDSIPRELKHATAEFARQIIEASRSADNEAETQGLKSLVAGPVEMEFRDNVTAKVIPDAVFHLLPRDWGYPRSRKTSVIELARA